MFNRKPNGIFSEKIFTWARAIKEARERDITAVGTLQTCFICDSDVGGLHGNHAISALYFVRFRNRNHDAEK